MRPPRVLDSGGLALCTLEQRHRTLVVTTHHVPVSKEKMHVRLLHRNAMLCVAARYARA
jgi:hypothetical protein